MIDAIIAAARLLCPEATLITSRGHVVLWPTEVSVRGEVTLEAWGPRAEVVVARELLPLVEAAHPEEPATEELREAIREYEEMRVMALRVRARVDERIRVALNPQPVSSPDHEDSVSRAGARGEVPQ